MVLESNTLDVLFVKDGQQGEDGKILYTWIKYAKDANGTGITDDPNGAIYIGISYNNESSIESNDPTHYAWTKIQGVDGKKGEDAYTIFLENENISFATDENRNPLSEQAYTSGITIMKGAKPVTDFTIGDIAKTQGIAVAKTDTAIAISVINGNPLPSDSGEIEIPITVGGTAFKKILTWTCAKKGDQGEKGEQGIQGPQGEQGIAGKDGTSVTITNKSITYQLSTSGTTIPTGTWQTTPQAIPEGQYQWTKTSVTYSDGNKTESYSISYHGKNGSDGTSVKTTSTSVKYQVGDSGTTKPTGTWQSNVPTVAQGKYLWTQTIVNYSDGNSTESYSVSYRGIDGSNGVNGMNAATIYLYQRATSTPSKPSNTLTYTFSTTTITGTLNNGWSTAIPTGTDAVYVTVASVSSKNDTATIATSAWSAPVVLAQNGKTGSDGKAGLNVATIYLYQRNTSKPSKPSASVTYTFSTGVASGLNNGWSQKIPDGTNPLYVTLATASSNTATDTILSSEWSDVVVMAQNGEDGQDGISPKVTLSKSGDTTTISIVDATGTHTQTVKDGTNGTPGAAGKDGKTSYFHVKYSNDGGKTFTGNSGEDTGIYMGSYTDYTEADSTDVSKYTWVKVKGDKGDTGQKGDNAKNLSITPSSQYFKSTDGGKTFAPNAITIKPTIQGEINFGKWQYSIDGGVSFVDVVSGQKGLTISNNVLTVSKDSSLYSDAVTMVTFRAVANDSSFYDTCSIAKIYDVSDIQIGGRNLILNSDKEYVMGYGIPNTTWTDGYAYIGLPTTRINDEILPQNNAFLLHPEAGKTYTQTIWIETDANIIDLNAAEVSWFTGKYGHVLVAAKIIKLADNSYKLTSTHTVTKEDSDIRLFDIMFLFSALDISNSGTYLKFGKLKVEQGNVSTDWTPATEDVQTAILSTKSEISDVSLKVDNNKQAIEKRVEKTTYQQDLNLVKGDISKANEGLNKWRYEIYPKSLFASEYQGKSTIDVFAKNTNLTPSQSVLINDMDLSIAWNYDNNYIGYALTFAKFSAAKSVAITFAHDDGAHIYLNGKLIGGSDAYSQTGESLTLGFVKGWNCIEVVVNEGASTEGFKLGTTISAISECQLMNCYYGTPVARQSHITNQLVENTTNIEGVTTTMQKVMTTVGGSDRIDEFVNNYNKTIESEKQFKKTIGETYTTKDEFNGLEIGGRNLLTEDDCNMSKWQNLYPAHCKVTNNDYSNHIDYVPTSGEWEIVYKKISITKGQKYILSFDYKVNKAYNYLSGQKYGVYLSTSVPTNAAPANIITNGQYVIENTVTNIKRGMITFTATVDTVYIVINGGCIDDNQTGLSFEFNKWKLERGNKATDWTPAPEDNEINGQNLVSNLPSNWEQGSFVVEDDSKNKTYSEVKVSEKTQIRIKELIPVFGDITISAQATQNSSKEALNHYVMLFDVNKRYMGKHNVNGWNTSFPRMFNCGDAKYIAIALKWGDGIKTQITPSDISQICLKIERGTSATPFTLAPEDVNGKIVNVETIANQTANKFEWIVKGGDNSSNFTLTDRVADLVAERINFKGLVKFSGLSTDAKSDILNSFEVGGINLISDTRDMKSWAKGGKLTITYDQLDIKNNTNAIKVVNSKSTAGNAYLEPPNRGPLSSGKYTVSFYAKTDSTSGADVSVLITDEYTKTFKINNIWTQYIITFDVANDIPVTNNFFWFNFFGTTEPIYFCYVKLEKGNKPTDWSPNPEDYLPQANLVSNWTTNSTWIDGGKIYTGSITADKIATDAIKSRNYISSGGTQGSFLNLSDGSFQSPNLSWDANGNLIAKNANLSGQITATKGTVGGWSIIPQELYYGQDDFVNNFPSDISNDATSSKGNAYTVAYQKKKNGSSFSIYAQAGGSITSFLSGNYGCNYQDLNLNTTEYYTQSMKLNKENIILSRSVFNPTPQLSNYQSDLYHPNQEQSIEITPGQIQFKLLYTDYGTTDFSAPMCVSSIYCYADGLGISTPNYLSLSAEYGVGISVTDPSKYNAIETTGDAIIGGNMVLRDRSDGRHKVAIYPYDGCIEMYGNTPYIDFHYSNSTSDYTSRIIAQKNWDCLTFTGSIELGVDLYAGGYIYNSSGGHYTWNGRTDAYISCGDYNGHNVYYYANYHAFYVNKDSGQGMMYINTNGVTSRVGFTKTSDERIKKNFESFDDNIINAYMNIEPVKYQLKQSSNDNYHFGFKAQHVDKVFSDYGDTYNESFDICTSRPIDPDKAKELYGVDDMTEEYGLRYDELIAPTTYMVQHIYKELESTKGELTKVKQEKADLETRLQAIEAKLGL